MRLKVTALSAQIPCSRDAKSKCLLALGKGDRDGGGKARGGSPTFALHSQGSVVVGL